MDWCLEYRPGSSLLIVSGPRLVMLRGDEVGDIVGGLWDLAQQQAGILDLLEALSAHGLAAVPDAVVTVEDHDGCVILLKGSMQGQADGRTIDATGRYTWTETRIDAQEFQIFADRADAQVRMADEQSSMNWLPVQSGIVLCSEVRVTRREGTQSGPVDERPEAVVMKQQRTLPEPEPRSESDGSPADEVHDGGLDSEEERAGHEEPGIPEPDPTDSDQLENEPGVDAEPEDDYDRLFGETSLVNRRSSEGTTEELQVPEADADESSKVAAAGDTETATLLPVRSLQPSAPQPPASVKSLGSGGLIDEVPGMSGPVEPPDAAESRGLQPSVPILPPAPTNVDHPITGASSPPLVLMDDGIQGDHDGRTVLRPSRRPSGDSASVRAIVCPQGHANPPEAVACRVCGFDIGDVPIQTIARPSIGVLRLLNPVQGAPDSVDLDRSVVIGRKPHHAAGMDPSDRLVVVDVAGGELSRNHMRVTLEGWHVLVTDLGSTNGTVITPPANEPVRLRGRDATPISAGTLITLAETITYRFEVG